MRENVEEREAFPPASPRDGISVARERESEGKREKREREEKREERKEGREGENEREEERGRGIQFSSSFRAAHARAQ